MAASLALAAACASREEAPLPTVPGWRVPTLAAVRLGAEYHHLKRVVPGAAFAPGVGLVVPGEDTLHLQFAARGERLRPAHESLTLETAPLVQVEQRHYAASAGALATAAAPWVAQLTTARGAPVCTWQDATAEQGAVAQWQWGAGNDAVLRVVVQQAQGERPAVARLVWAQTTAPTDSTDRPGPPADCEAVRQRVSGAQ